MSSASTATSVGKIAKSVEQAINAALTMDAAAQKHLKRLDGCVLAVHVTSTDSTFYFGVKAPESDQPDERYLVELLPAQESATIHLGGSILSLVKLTASANKAILFKTKELSLSGDAVRIQQLQSFLSSISIDWEAILANFIGDVPAHFIGSSLRSSLGWGINFSKSLVRDAEEYIKYELRLFPNRAIAQKQFKAIEELQKATDALESRFKKTLAYVTKPEKSTPAS